jgi:Transglycosylase SLT domain
MTSRLGPWPALALLLCLTLPVAAGAGQDPAAICERAIVDGARRSGVPESVLHAISLTETGRPSGGRLRPWPWAINREGRGHWFASRDEALAFARASLAAGRPSFDVSCFQINYRHHGHNFPSLESMFDPDVSADYAAQFLRSLYAELGSWSSAAGAYHSRTPARASAYRARFDRILAGLGGAPLVVAEAAPETGNAAPPRKSRTRMTRGPKIITLPRDDPAAAPEVREAALRGLPPVALTEAPVLEPVAELWF